MEKSYAERLKAARARLGLTREQAAERWGFSLRTLEHYEQGGRSPRGLYRDKLERVLRRIEPKS
jgi:transcriptional regulator with XRE-family HTH domain